MTGGAFHLRRLFLSLPLLATACSPGRGGDADGVDLEQAIDREAGKMVSQGVSDAFVIGVVKQGRTWTRSYGDRPLNGAARPDGDSVFQIGSLTKIFTVVTLLSLVREGLVSLDDDLTRVVGDRVPLSTAAGAITLRQLASHTSGLPPIPASLMMLPRDDADPYSRLTREDIYRYLATARGLRPPGRVEYSNYGMGLLGHVLEDRAGASLEQLMATRIFAPLSMSSTFMTPLGASARSVVPGASEAGDPAPIWRFGALGGAGALCSTANDMLAFIEAVLTADGPLDPVWSAIRRERGPNDARLGWMAPSPVDRIAGNRTIIWHNGRVGGYASYLSIDVAQRTGVAILSARSAEITMSGVMLSRAARVHDWREIR